MRNLLFIVLLGCSLSTWSQGVNYTSSKKPIESNEYWNLSKYIWSHSHPSPVKGGKPILDFNAIDNWETIGPDGDVAISNDGRYFSYSVSYSRDRSKDSLIIQSTNNTWRQAYSKAMAGFFSNDSKQYVFKRGDDLCFLQTGANKIYVLQEVTSYKQLINDIGTWLAFQTKGLKVVLKNLVTGKDEQFDSVNSYVFDYSRHWLIMQLNNESKELVLYNLENGKTSHFQSVLKYTLDATGKLMILNTMGNSGGKSVAQLQYVSLKDGLSTLIWSGQDDKSGLITSTFDGTGEEVAFIIQSNGKDEKFDKSSQRHNKFQTIWYWKKGMENAVQKLNSQNAVVEPGFEIRRVAFTNNGKHIIFTMEEGKSEVKPDPNVVKLDVWSYADTILQSTQPYLINKVKSYQAVANTESDKILLIENAFEKIKRIYNDYAIVAQKGDLVFGDRFWEKDYNQDSNWLVSLQDGSRILLNSKAQDDIWFSQDGNYIVYFDTSEKGIFYSYNINSKKLINISPCLPPPCQFKLKSRFTSGESNECGLAGWIDGNGLLAYDNYDIWQLDMTGKKAPVNITNGYGRKNKIKFMLAGKGEFGQFDKNISWMRFPTNCPLMFKAFNTVNKKNGIYRKVLGTFGDPECLTMGLYSLGLIPISTIKIRGDRNNIMASEESVWIIKRESPTQSPNYFFTSDFKNFKALTNLQPQQRYNWLTASLHRFKQQDKVMSDGILYKPENFDPKKKYPVIIAIYSFPSQNFTEFPKPGYIVSPVAILDQPAWMVSHGYLVFTPDIYFAKGLRGKSAFNAAEGAVQYLKSLPYVDGNKIGLVGHSASGKLAYYILTHSHSFAAISIGSGSVNEISNALSLDLAGFGWMETSRLSGVESEMGNIWKNISLWLSESPIMSVDKVVSPYLMFHNKIDVVPNQAVEMFIALRRMEKRGWWLRYDNGDHVVRGSDAKDFTIRYTQFFDHYLKNAPPPKWMTEGVPYKLKGIEARYELDMDGSCGKDCSVCKKRLWR